MRHACWSAVIIVTVTALLGLPGCDNRDRVIDGIEFVWCPPGTYMMGRAPGDSAGGYNEDPQHAVTFARGFWISKCEITEKQWMAVMDGSLPNYNGYHPASMDNRPVGLDSWNDVQDFLAAPNPYL